MELYEILYTVPAGEIAEGDLIRFYYEDSDENRYIETVHVGEVDYEENFVVVTGFSEELNISDTFYIFDDATVEVLGG